MYKRKIVSLLIMLLVIIGLINCSYATQPNTQPTNTFDSDKYHDIEAFSVPEKDINLKIENLSIGCNVYLLLPTDLLSYNLEKFINNNLIDNYDIQKKKAEDLKEFYDNEDFLGYIDYLKAEGFYVEPNEMELRHYCFGINDEIEIIGYEDYNEVNYVKFKIVLNENGEFKIKMKDYLVDYDTSKISFLIDEAGIKTYINVSDYPVTANAEKPNISEYNINYTFTSTEYNEEVDKAIFYGYLIVFFIIALIILLIILHEVKKYKAHKQEIRERLFWKKKTPKEEKQAEKERIKQELKEIKEKRKRNKKKK